MAAAQRRRGQIRSGTRTRSSTRRTSSRSTTRTATASATSAGSIEKLDYLQDLGITCLWLLPLFPSPLKDDGYDIADYRGIHPDYGTLEDFRELVAAAHARGIRVLVELVVNHTSDQHPWFQRARRAPPGSPERDFYVWSDTDQTLPGRAHHLHRHREVELDLGPGGQAVLLAPVLLPPARPQLRQPARCCARCSTRSRFWVELGRGRVPARRGAVPLRAGRHQLREPARDARRHPADPAPSWTSTSRAACSSPRPTSGPTTCGPTSATATSATWRSTSRSCRASSWRCGWRTWSRSSRSCGARRPSRTPASGRCSCATTTS